MKLVEETRGALSENETKIPRQRTPKPRQSAIEKLTPAELNTLHLGEAAHSQFDALVQQFVCSTGKANLFRGADVAAMDDARYDERSAAEAELHRSGMAVVHFMAPRILKMREGASKRKWRSFLAKFRRDEQLS